MKNKSKIPSDRAFWVRDWDWEKYRKERDFTVYERKNAQDDIVAAIEVVDNPAARSRTIFSKYIPHALVKETWAGKNQPLYIESAGFPFMWMAVLWVKYHLHRAGYRSVPDKLWNML